MKFFKVFFVTLGKVYSVCSTIGDLLPGSLYLACKHCGIDPDFFKGYRVCKLCHHVWKLSDCIELSGGTETVKLCSFIPLSVSASESLWWCFTKWQKIVGRSFCIGTANHF